MKLYNGYFNNSNPPHPTPKAPDAQGVRTFAQGVCTDQRESAKSGRENGDYLPRRPQNPARCTKKAGLERPACRCHIKVCVSILHAIIQLRCPSCSVTDACSCCNATERLPELR